MRVAFSAAVVAAWLSACPVAACAEELEVAPAIAAASAWLETVDAGRYGAAWERAAEIFRARVSEGEWEKLVVAARQPLGTLVGRKMRAANYVRTLPGAPDGGYVVLRYDAAFTDRALATETVTAMLDKDGTWRVSGYLVR